MTERKHLNMQPNNNNSKNKPRQNNNQRRGNNQGQKPQQPKQQQQSAMSTSRGQAVRAQKRSQMDARRIVAQYATANATSMRGERRANVIDDTPRLRMIGLGGMDGGGSKNMILIEYLNDAIVTDCGNDLGVD